MTLTLYIPTRIALGAGINEEVTQAERAAGSRSDAVDRLLAMVGRDFDRDDRDELLDAAGDTLEKSDAWEHDSLCYAIVTTTLEVAG